VGVEQLGADVEVAARARRARELAQDALRPAHAPAFGLPRDHGQGHAQAPPGDPHLVDGLLLAGESPRQVLEKLADPLLEQRCGRIDGGRRGSHAEVPEDKRYRIACRPRGPQAFPGLPRCRRVE
jgi:hypothetical protein